MPDLETVSLEGVEILAADVTIHGRGSPPAGDRYSTGDLQAMADAHRELVSEMQPAAWIGHSRDQPAVGHLENLRVSTDGKRLLADVNDVPKKFAELLNSKAYNSRSVELSRVTSQLTGRTYERVVSGLAWLGAKLPAVGVLADVIALYEADDVTPRRMYVVHANGEGSASADVLLDHAVSTGRIVDADRPRWARALEERGENAIRELAQLPPDTALGDADYARDYAARHGEQPRLDQFNDVDPESRAIAARLGLNPTEVL